MHLVYFIYSVEEKTWGYSEGLSSKPKMHNFIVVVAFFPSIFFSKIKSPQTNDYNDNKSFSTSAIRAAGAKLEIEIEPKQRTCAALLAMRRTKTKSTR